MRTVIDGRLRQKSTGDECTLTIAVDFEGQAARNGLLSEASTLEKDPF